MRQRLIAGGAILFLAGLLGWMLFGWHPEPTTPAPGTALRAAPTGGDFVLESKAGPVRLGDLRGKVVVLYFGYTWCPDICPTSLGFLATALSGMTPDEVAQIRPIFVSVDPARDDPERLAQYTAFFNPAIIGATGTPAELQRMADAYGAAFRRVDQPGSAMGYVMDHTAELYLLDRDGRLVRTLKHGTPPGAIRDALRELMGPHPPTT